MTCEIIKSHAYILLQKKESLYETKKMLSRKAVSKFDFNSDIFHVLMRISYPSRISMNSYHC